MAVREFQAFKNVTIVRQMTYPADHGLADRVKPLKLPQSLPNNTTVFAPVTEHIRCL